MFVIGGLDGDTALTAATPCGLAEGGFSGTFKGPFECFGCGLVAELGLVAESFCGKIGDISRSSDKKSNSSIESEGSESLPKRAGTTGS